jgi:hypothetical protein
MWAEHQLCSNKPASLTAIDRIPASERLDEVARIMAAGLIRLHSETRGGEAPDQGESSLPVSAEPSVHAPRRTGRRAA